MNKIRTLSESEFLKVFFGFIAAAFLIASLFMPDRDQVFKGLWQIVSQPVKISNNCFALGGVCGYIFEYGSGGADLSDSVYCFEKYAKQCVYFGFYSYRRLFIMGNHCAQYMANYSWSGSVLSFKKGKTFCQCQCYDVFYRYCSADFRFAGALS